MVKIIFSAKLQVHRMTLNAVRSQVYVPLIPPPPPESQLPLRSALRLAISKIFAIFFIFPFATILNCNTFSSFLALLDYVSRAHEIEISPSSVVVPSSVRPSVCVAIISEPNARISFQFWLLLSLGHTLTHFFFFFFFLNF